MSKNPHAHFGAPRFMKAFAAHGDFFASAAVAPQGASRWHLNQIYCECVAFTVKPRRVCRPQAAKKLESFSAGACTWQKILLRLQVWNLFACANKLCAQQPAKPSQKPRRGFWLAERQHSCCLCFCNGMEEKSLTGERGFRTDWNSSGCARVYHG